MTNITHGVWDFLSKNPAIEKALAENVVNVRALANHIIEREDMQASTHSVISAVRRYTAEYEIGPSKDEVSEILKNSKLSTKSRIVSIMINRDFKFLARVMPDIFKAINVNKGELLRIAEGRGVMKIFVDQRKKKDKLKLLPKADVFEIKENRGEINIYFDESKGDVPGIVAAVLHELAANGVNMKELIGGWPELVIIVKEEDISRTHDLLLRFFYGRG